MPQDLGEAQKLADSFEASFRLLEDHYAGILKQAKEKRRGKTGSPGTMSGTMTPTWTEQQVENMNNSMKKKVDGGPERLASTGSGWRVGGDGEKPWKGLSAKLGTMNTTTG